VNGVIYKDIPRVFITLFENTGFVLDILLSTSDMELKEYWKVNTSEKTKILDWINLVSSHSQTMQSTKHLDIKKLLKQLLF
ncbi:MAG: hypothetical protein WBO36_06495, partial [Saprospiraceae bacterium]